MADAATLPVLLRQLRLPTMAGCCEEVMERAITHGWSIATTLATLCEYELAERERRRLERNQLSALACDTGWIDQARNLLLFGPSGVGKSHLAAAIGHSLIEQGLRVRYFAASALVQELQSAKQALRLSEALSKLDKYQLLVIDDIGYVKRSVTQRQSK